MPVRTFFMLMLRSLLWLVPCVSSTSLSSIHRVFISNLQKEIEKQTGYRSSRKRRSESQYDYEVYHSLEEVDVKPTKQTTSLSSSQTQKLPRSTALSLSLSDCSMLSHTDTSPGSWVYKTLWSNVNSTHTSWELTQTWALILSGHAHNNFASKCL